MPTLHWEGKESKKEKGGKKERKKEKKKMTRLVSIIYFNLKWNPQITKVILGWLRNSPLIKFPR